MAKPLRNHEIEERVTPFGMLREAVEFFCASIAAERSMSLDFDYACSPVFANLGQAIELALKALLREDGKSPEDMRVDFRHNLSKCLEHASARRYSLKLEPVEQNTFDSFSVLYYFKDYHYFGAGIVTGAPSHLAVEKIARSILRQAMWEIDPAGLILRCPNLHRLFSDEKSPPLQPFSEEDAVAALKALDRI
jgi:HEPN domain-containing protein